MKQGDKLICTRETVFNSFPENHIVKKDEIVYVEGFIHGNLVIRLGAHHKSGYDHIPYCSAMIADDRVTRFKEVRDYE